MVLKKMLRKKGDKFEAITICEHCDYEVKVQGNSYESFCERQLDEFKCPECKKKAFTVDSQINRVSTYSFYNGYFLGIMLSLIYLREHKISEKEITPDKLEDIHQAVSHNCDGVFSERSSLQLAIDGIRQMKITEKDFDSECAEHVLNENKPVIKCLLEVTKNILKYEKIENKLKRKEEKKAA